MWYTIRGHIIYLLFGGVWMKRVPIGVEDFKELISNNYYVELIKMFIMLIKVN